GAMQNFISSQSVMQYLGKGAKRWTAYLVAAVSGAVLAVCSCTILPLFMGIYKRGAGLGPAATFLYSGPAINVLAIILTARVLGWRIGFARAIGAILFAIVIGLLMALFFKDEEEERQRGFAEAPTDETGRTPGQTAAYFGTLIGILVFAAWGKPSDTSGFWHNMFTVKWYLVAALLAFLAYQLIAWFEKDELSSWMSSTWSFAKQVLPLLMGGVMISGFLMGTPGVDNGVIPASLISGAVGSNSFGANLSASLVGALMYFATLTEVPILQSLIGSGMGQGPALALLLAGPALSLPSMLVINSILGSKKTLVYILLVVAAATISGMLLGAFVV
ncbi:MAG: permease, partial [Firmicutes bacterium]|nr:permease [Bacillota bacterium]